MLQGKKGKYRTIRLKVLLPIVAFILMSSVPLLSPNAAARPTMDVGIGLSSSDVEPGDVLKCRIFFNNTGHDVTPILQIEVTFSPHMDYLYDKSMFKGGFRAGDYEWVFTNVSTGIHNFDIHLRISGGAEDGESMMISARLDYRDKLNIPMPTLSTSATATARRPELLLVKSFDTPMVYPGQVFNHTVAFQNVGSRRASLVYVNYDLPPTQIYLDDTASSNGGETVDFLNWSFSDVMHSHSFDIQLQTLADLSDGTQLSHKVTLFYMNANEVWFKEEFSSYSVVVGSLDMSFQKTVDNTIASAGDLLDYTLWVSNNGQGTAKTVQIGDSLPIGTTYESSSPACDSIINNRCTWTLHNFGPGECDLHINARVDVSTPSGSILTNAASLDYTNSMGVPQGSLSSHATTLVKESHIVIVDGDDPPGHKSNTSLGIDDPIGNSLPLPSATTWLNMSFPTFIQYLSDNATDIGGNKTDKYRWRFKDIPEGNQSFTIVTQISNETAINETSEMDIQLDHTDGNDQTVTEKITTPIDPPTVSSGITSNKKTYGEGDTLVFTIFVNNTGSSLALTVWVNLSIPSSAIYIDDTSALIGGLYVGDLSYLFSDVGPGDHEFLLYLNFDGDAGQLTQVEVWVFLNYTDNNGDFAGESMQRASCNILGPSEQFPITTVSVIVFFACLISFAAASGKESLKYSLLPFLVPLYSRLRKKHILDHELRGMIRDYITENPGEHFNSIKSELNLRNGTLSHHLSVLERENIVKSVKDGKYRRFFPVGMMLSDKAYPTTIEKRILDAIREKPGIIQKNIAIQLGLCQSTVNYHISKLKKLERIRTEKNGISLRHYIVDSDW
jgi:uncharacterized repeat protein (TIGR01451 family)